MCSVKGDAWNVVKAVEFSTVPRAGPPLMPDQGFEVYVCIPGSPPGCVVYLGFSST